ncbi:MAG: hypothetical protein IK083_02305 [Abditibacteriota bacterium]|nr:hypothetical protein [Abditibacteriota bacterium]
MKKLYMIALLLALVSPVFAAHLFPGDFAPDKGILEARDIPVRGEMCLNGEWEFRGSEDPEASYEQASSSRVPISIPSPWNVNSYSQGRGGDFRCYPSYPADWDRYMCGYMTRSFRLSSLWRGRVIYAEFKAVAGPFEVYVNGSKAGEGFDSFLPFRFDITPYVRWDGDNTLRLRVRKSSVMNKKSKGGDYTYPTGSFWGMHIAGVWQDVYITSENPVACRDVFVIPEPDTDRVKALVTLVNRTGAKKRIRVAGSIFDWVGGDSSEDRGRAGSRAGAFGSVEVELEPGSSEEAVLYADASGLEKWSMDHPVLYLASVSLSVEGRTCDSLSRRFGYRSFDIVGDSLYLNGEKVVLKGDSWHFMGIPQLTRRYARAWFTAIKDAGGNAVRLHAQPYPEFYLDVADEMGIAVLDESGIWDSHCAFNFLENETWERFASHIEKLVTRDRNHPSVFGWSVENESVPCAYMYEPEEKADIVKRLCSLTDIIRRLDPTRDWISADGSGDLDGYIPVDMLHYADMDSCKKAAAKGGPWGVGESGAAYYGTPRDLEWYGDTVYIDQQRRMEALACEAYDHLVNRQLANNAAYASVFNMVWYGLKPLALGMEDTSREPALTDGIFFAKQRDGQHGAQPQRLGPYCTTLNPGYDPNLPLYEPWPLFDAVKAAYTGDTKDFPYTEIPKSASAEAEEPHILQVAYAQESSRMVNTLRFAGWPVEDMGELLLVDGTGIDAKNYPEIASLVTEYSSGGKPVLIWGFTEESLPYVNKLLPVSADYVQRESTSLVSDVLPNRLLYFTQSSNQMIMKYGIGGEALKKGERLIDPSGADWRRWNYEPENIKTGSLYRSEREYKPDASALVRLKKDRGDIYLCSMSSEYSGDMAAMTAGLAAYLGIVLRDNDEDTDSACSSLGVIRKMKQSAIFPAKTFEEAMQTEYVAFDDPAEGWKTISADRDSLKFDLDGTNEDCASYLSLWIHSPRALDEILLDPDAPKLYLVGCSDDGCKVFLNGSPVFEDARIHSCAPEYFGFETRLLLKQGWNRLLVKVAQGSGEYQFMGNFECNDPQFWQTVTVSLDRE